MPNKSDSVGKLHQYYTSLNIKNNYPHAKYISILNNRSKRLQHEKLFNLEEKTSLQRIGDKSAKLIIKNCNTIDIISIEESWGGDVDNTDDLIINLSDNSQIGYSLKATKNPSQILSKNMGAKSLIKEYFLSDVLQKKFNIIFNINYLIFLNSILNTNYKDISLAKQNINRHAEENGKTKARFIDKNYDCANTSRNVFLNSLRKKLYTICKSLETNNIIHACNLILDSGKNHIIANYTYDKEDAYLNIIPIQNNSNYEEINLRGNDSVKILLADYEIGFRYKFESGITSSIKLVGDYKSNHN